MDYRKEYEEAVKRAMAMIKVAEKEEEVYKIAVTIFPELKESKDEKVRKALKHYLEVRRCQTNNDEEYVNCNRFLAWLEKQGKQKTYGQRKECVDCQFNYAGECKGSCAMKRDEQKPATWSEEDEHRVKDTVYFLDTAKKHYASVIELDACIDWLKQLKQRIGWKPSKGQLECLSYAIDKVEKDYNPLANNRICLTLKALKEQLEKL